MSSFGEDGRSIDAVSNVSDYTRQIVDYDELESIAHFKHLVKWWRQVNEETHRLPSRKDFNPAAFQAILPNISLFEPIFENEDLINCKVLLMGTELTKVYGEGTGELLTDVNNDYVVQTVLNSMRECIRIRKPIGITSEAASEELPFMRSFALYCPLSTDNSHIDKILLHIVFE